MRDHRRFKLLHGPYVGPRCRPGIKLFCEIRGWVVVGKMSDGRIAWPMCRAGKRARAFILCGDLVKAIQRESNIAVCHWWGVTAQTVTAWRKALGVPRLNEGTGRLYREYAPERLTVEARIKARKALRFPDVREKIARRSGGSHGLRMSSRPRGRRTRGGRSAFRTGRRSARRFDDGATGQRGCRRHGRRPRIACSEGCRIPRWPSGRGGQLWLCVADGRCCGFRALAGTGRR
jgi:hypothetical protein